MEDAVKSCIKELFFSISFFPPTPLYLPIISLAVPSDFLSFATYFVKSFFLLAMSKRPASGSPQDRPAKKNASNSHQAIGPLTPRYEQVCPHEGCPHHSHAATTSDPLQHLTPGSIYGSPAQASHGRYIEYPWHLMPPTPNSTDPVSIFTQLAPFD
jgi:hypothetical protein